MIQIKAEGDVIVGEARDAICSAVDQLQANLLIVGSHGYGPVKRSVIYSMAISKQRVHAISGCLIPASSFLTFVQGPFRKCERVLCAPC